MNNLADKMLVKGHICNATGTINGRKVRDEKKGIKYMISGCKEKRRERCRNSTYAGVCL